MNRLPLRESQASADYNSKLAHRQREHQSPGLPTPETASTSSYEGNESPQSNGHRSLPYGCLPSIGNGFDNIRPIANPATRDSHRESAFQPQLESSPTHPFNSSRPFLPPLKTMLTRDISSPPPPTSMQGISAQPSPREPKLASTTFKPPLPPSLYPNKKQRIDRFQPVGRIPSPSNVALSRQLSTPSQQKTTAMSVDPRRSYPRADAQYHPSMSNQRPHLDSARHYPPHPQHEMPVQLPSPSYHYRSPVESALPSGTRDYNFSEHAPTSASSDFNYRFGQPNATPAHRNTYLSPATAHSAQWPDEHRPTSDRPPSSGYGHYHYHSMGSADVERVPPMPDPRRSASDGLREDMEYEDSPDYEPAEQGQYQPRTQHHYNFGRQQDKSPIFITGVPDSAWDSQIMKGRKRNNLPKDSIEVMKTWFDEHISNPYPSEEQKAIFSQITGITAVQVSNWFINHRRRCPELRDKRERYRGRP